MTDNVRGRRFVALLFAVMLTVAAGFLVVRNTHIGKIRPADIREEALTIACGDDLAGLVLDAMLEDSQIKKVDMGLDFVSLGDCCGSNAQFALSTGEIDAAMLCPDAAVDLLASGEYVDCGAVIYDGNVLVTRPDSKEAPAVIGYMNQREEQRQLLEMLYDPKTVKLQPMFPSGLAYALENKAVDAIVLDASAALRLKYPAQPLSRGHVSTTLIVKSSLLGDARLTEFLERYRSFSDTLAREEVLGSILCQYLETDRQEEVINYWKTLNVQFGSPTMGTN